MNIFKLSIKIIRQIMFVIIFFTTVHAKNMDKFNDADRVSNYFSGILLLSENEYNESFEKIRWIRNKPY